MLQHRQIFTLAAILSLTLCWHPMEIRGEDTKQEKWAEAATLRLNAARSAFLEFELLYDTGEATAEELYTWSIRLLDSQLAAAVNGESRMDALLGHLGRMKTRVDALAKLGGKACPSKSTKLALDYYYQEARQFLLSSEAWRFRKSDR